MVFSVSAISFPFVTLGCVSEYILPGTDWFDILALGLASGLLCKSVIQQPQLVGGVGYRTFAQWSRSLAKFPNLMAGHASILARRS